METPGVFLSQEGGSGFGSSENSKFNQNFRSASTFLRAVKEAVARKGHRVCVVKLVKGKFNVACQIFTSVVYGFTFSLMCGNGLQRNKVLQSSARVDKTSASAK